jgi:hypothetical protein
MSLCRPPGTRLIPGKSEGEYSWERRRKKKKSVVKNTKRRKANAVPIAPRLEACYQHPCEAGCRVSLEVPQGHVIYGAASGWPSDT